MSKDANKMEETRQAMATIGREIEKRLPDGYGYFVMITAMKEGGRANYSSNMERVGVLNTMKEFIVRNNGTEEDWMKEIF